MIIIYIYICWKGLNSCTPSCLHFFVPVLQLFKPLRLLPTGGTPCGSWEKRGVAGKMQTNILNNPNTPWDWKVRLSRI